jgi:CspA family cold shock protein
LFTSRAEHAVKAFYRSPGKEGLVSDRQTGTIKWFDRIKGYGFISQLEGPELFVHHKSIIDIHALKKLVSGQSVSYIATEGRPGKGMQAEQVEAVAV